VKRFSISMRFLSVIYGFVGLLFIFFHKLLLNILQMEPAPNRFWLVLSLSMMVMLSFVSWKSSKDPSNKTLIDVHLLSKITSTTTFLLCFALEQHLWGYLVGAAVDFSVACFVFLISRGAGATR
jgi:drug/metabolite transporter (DMT)-like permease